jgi:hypothetical protein
MPKHPFPDRVGSFPPGHVNAPAFRSPRCLPPEKTPRALFRELTESAASLAGENSRRTCSSMFENID